MISIFGLASPALALPSLVPVECQGDAPLTDCDAECTADKEDRSGCCCNLNSVERVAVNITEIVLGISGALALLLFVIGGVYYIISGGDSGRIKKATGILKTTVIGLAIIIFAGVAIKLLLATLTGQ